MPALLGSLQRELAHLRNDRGDFFLAVLLMPLLCLLIWWIFSAGQPSKLPVAVIDQDRSSLSRQLTRLINAAPGVLISEQFQDIPTAIDALRQRKVYAVLLLPKNLETTIYRGESADLVLQLNTQYTTYASTIQRDIQQAVLTAGTGISTDRLQRMGLYDAESMTVTMPIQVLATPLYNEGPSYEVFLSATLIPALFQILAMVLTVSAIGRELRDSTARDWLNSAHGSVFTALLGKLLPYLILLAAYGAAYILLFYHLAPESYGGSSWAAYFTFILMVAGSMSISILIIAITRNFRMGLSVAGFYSAPAFAYSGQAFPLVAMPELAQAWASILPLTHWLKIYNQLWLAGAPWASVITPLTVLVLMCLSAIPGGLLLKKLSFHPASWGGR